MIAYQNGHVSSGGPAIVAPHEDLYLEVQQAAEFTKGLNKRILRNATDPYALLRIVEQVGNSLHVLNVCTLLHRLARCLARHPSTLSQRSKEIQDTQGFRQLMTLVRKYAGICNNMELTNCLWAIATLDMRNEEETVLALLEVAVIHLHTFDSRSLSVSGWAVAKMGCTDRQWSWCRHWADASLRRLHLFEPRDRTMVIWAFATVHWKDEAFLERFCDEIPRYSSTCTPQDLGNTLWALATLYFRHEGALAALCAQCFVMAEKFDQQNLGIIMWSLATLQYRNMNLMHLLTQQATDRVQSLSSQGMSNICWALAKFQFQQKCLLMTVAAEAVTRADEFSPQHLAILAWAYATLEFPNRPLLTALCQAATRQMHTFSPQHMANLTWAMATLAHKDEEYLRAMVKRAVELTAEFNPQECSNLAWSLALLTFRDDALLAALSVRSKEIVREFIPQNLGNSAWAYNRLGYRDEILMDTLLIQAAAVLQECQGQEILDLIEAIVTGGYVESVNRTAWGAINAWIEDRSVGATQFVERNAAFALEWPSLSDFDRALAVQDYRDHLASFNVIGLGYSLTATVLEGFGVDLPKGDALDSWKLIAGEAAVGARNESDASKNSEAQAGLRACRTVCVHRYSLHCDGKMATRDPIGVASGPAVDAWELGLVAATLKHNRGGDGEFQALQACAQACLTEFGLDPLKGEGARASGELWLHVSEVPCLSCVSAMAQFRALFPNIVLRVSFTLGRQPASTSCSTVADIALSRVDLPPGNPSASMLPPQRPGSVPLSSSSEARRSCTAPRVPLNAMYSRDSGGYNIPPVRRSVEAVVSDTHTKTVISLPHTPHTASSFAEKRPELCSDALLLAMTHQDVDCFGPNDGSAEDSAFKPLESPLPSTTDGGKPTAQSFY